MEEYQLPSHGVVPITPNQQYVGPSEDFFKFRIDGGDIIDNISHQLRGEVFDESKGEWVKKYEARVNEEGLNVIIYIIYTLGNNKNIYMSTKKADRINYMCWELERNLYKLFFLKYQQYGIKKELRKILINSIVAQVEAGLYRSEGGMEARLLSQASSRYEIFSHNQAQQQKGGILGKLPFIGKFGNR